MNFKEFLENKPLFYKEIDYDRMPRIWQSIKHRFKLPKIIHIVGTNGKGTTGRYLALLLYSEGKQVGHYTSPHILEFNERVWIDGDSPKDKQLQNAHEFLLSILSQKEVNSLSYFEYTTLMAMKLFEGCDYVLLEAGMGGEYDATSVFGNDLSIITPIDFDHQEFLGENITDIASTKLKSIKKCAILGKQPNKEVYEVAQKLSKQVGFKLYDYKTLIDDKTNLQISNFAQEKQLPHFLKDNLSLAISAFKYLGYEINQELPTDLQLPGRCQKLSKNITIDVGHNALAAKALKSEFMGKKVTLVYNSYKDKDYEEILKILKPIIKKVEILPIENDRVEDGEVLKKSILNLGIEVFDFKGIKESEEYLVFGSFSVVEKFLKDFCER